MRSFKVLTECPIAVVLVFQTWKTIVFPYITSYFPLVMEASILFHLCFSNRNLKLTVGALSLQCLTLQPEPQRRAYEEAAKKGELFVGVSDEIQNRELYTELIVAQVKVRS